MNDRELLSLAAKAAGYQVYIWGAHGEESCARTDVDPHAKWNPLTDDGDALRLAVDLGLQVYGREIGCSVNEFLFVDEADCGHDKYAATRRAIVMCAAEIGRNMQ